MTIRVLRGPRAFAQHVSIEELQSECRRSLHDPPCSGVHPKRPLEDRVSCEASQLSESESCSPVETRSASDASQAVERELPSNERGFPPFEGKPRLTRGHGENEGGSSNLGQVWKRVRRTSRESRTISSFVFPRDNNQTQQARDADKQRPLNDHGVHLLHHFLAS